MRRHLAILLTLAVLPLSAGAQSAAPWDAFFGCWVNAEAPERQQQLCYVPTTVSASVAELVVLSGDSVVSRARAWMRGARDSRSWRRAAKATRSRKARWMVSGSTPAARCAAGRRGN